MSLFHRKPKPAHQLVGEYNEHGQLHYRCQICTRTFHSAAGAQSNGEYCCGKRCYSTYNLIARRIITPNYLMQIDEIKATGRVIRKGQEPRAYLHDELASFQDNGYYPLYDVRECVELSGAVTLPELR